MSTQTTLEVCKRRRRRAQFKRERRQWQEEVRNRDVVDIREVDALESLHLDELVEEDEDFGNLSDFLDEPCEGVSIGLIRSPYRSWTIRDFLRD